MALSLTRTDLGRDGGDLALAERLAHEIQGEVLFDRFDRGRYSTDASIYQIEPIGVVVPRSDADVQAALAVARAAGVAVIARGGGTSQAGQTIGSGLVIDYSKHLDRLLEFDAEQRTVWVEPGLVLDRLNRFLKPHGLFFPVDISTSSRATLGGMAANNACGARSIRYGIMVDNLLAIDALLADGEAIRFAEVPGNLEGVAQNGRYLHLIQEMRALAEREADAIARHFPKVLRRVGGYNLDRVRAAGHNMAELLVGSEGTLALFRRLQLKLQPLPAHKVLGVCHFPEFQQAMGSAKAIVELGPSAVELVDRTIIELGRKIPAYRPLIDRFVRGRPAALLLVEFAGDDRAAQLASLKRLGELMAGLGFVDAVVEAVEPAAQARIWEVRKAGLNIVMSMKGEGKPVSFIEDCAVPLEHLADYTRGLGEIFERHGTSGTWYAHASVGCLHVRPILNLKQDQGVRAMRAIAEEATAMVRAYKGAHSGEHGDGLVRSEFHRAMFGERLVRAFEQIKDTFDPKGVLNPGKIVRAPRMDERTLLRHPPGYHAEPIESGLDWQAWGGFLGAAEMCNNNGACRKDEPGVMCPSYRVTRDEMHVTRGRANSLRLALSGQLGADALTSDRMLEALELCVACKACRRECPTGVDMARMKIEVLHQVRKLRALALKDRLIAYLPRYAPYASRLRGLLHLRDRLPGAAALSERLLGFSARALPAALARQPLSSSRQRCAGRGQRSRGGAPGRHLHHVVRTGECPCRGGRAERGRLSRAAAGYARHAPALLRADLPCGRAARGSAPRGRADPGRAAALGRGRGTGDRPGALLPAHPARRVRCAAAGAADRGARRAGDAARGVPMAGAGRRSPAAVAEACRLAPRAAPWPLPSEGLRRDGRGRGLPQSGAGSRGRDRRVQLLRDGRRVRLRGQASRHVVADGASSPCCLRCVRRARTRWSSPTAPAAGTRSGTRAAARRSTSPACYSRRSPERNSPLPGAARPGWGGTVPS